MIISAKELGKNTVLTMDSITPHYAKAYLSKDSKSAATITFPLYQGSVFTTAYFSGGTPWIQTGVYFRTMTQVTKDPKSNVRKYNFVLEDGTTWRLYAYKTKGDPLTLKVTNQGLAASAKPFYGFIQIAKDPKVGQSEAVLDNGCGIYATGMTISGTNVGSQGTYKFNWSKAGHSSGKLWIFALPHHVDSFDATTKKEMRTYTMQTLTKGVATAVGGDSWTLVEPSLPVNMGFAPWDPVKGSRGLSTNAKKIIAPIAKSEVSQDMDQQANTDSMYFSGKVSCCLVNLKVYELTKHRPWPSSDRSSMSSTTCSTIRHWHKLVSRSSRLHLLDSVQTSKTFLLFMNVSFLMKLLLTSTNWVNQLFGVE